MKELKSNSQVTELKDLLKDFSRRSKVLGDFLKGQVVEKGLWRFFSDDFPSGGVSGWNAAPWRTIWPGLDGRVEFWGEDCFGNQLTLLPGKENAFLWNHENGGLIDLEMDPGTLLEVAASDGIDWLDFYSGGSLTVARTFPEVGELEQHLHWTKPLILGGETARYNVSFVERHKHLTGHAKLWSQVGGLPPGTEIRIL